MDGFLPFISSIREKCNCMEIRENELMSKHTSFKIGGPCRVMIIPNNLDELIYSLREAESFGLEKLVIGKGTNLLVSDAPLNKVVIKIADGFDEVELKDENTILAGAGASLSRIAIFAMSCSLAGFEFAHGIPGSLGGAIAMNAGAYGGEIKDVIKKVTYISETFEINTIDNRDCCFSYRHSAFSDTEKIIVSAEIGLSHGKKEDIKNRIDDLIQKRRQSQPLEMPSAGSTFKRPDRGFAAAMIDEAGLKGKGVGGAEVSEKHAGFVINRKDATFDDVCSTMELIQKSVYEKFGVMLEPEVKIIH